MKISKELILEAKKELARREFFGYCQLMLPGFYKKERDYLALLTNSMQSFLESDEDILIINVPPRHGKSLSAQMLATWVLGKDYKTKIMTASYNERLSTTFAKGVRNTIMTEKLDDNIVYSDIFPDTKVKYGEASASQWALEGSEQTNY